MNLYENFPAADFFLSKIMRSMKENLFFLNIRICQNWSAWSRKVCFDMMIFKLDKQLFVWYFYNISFFCLS